jgi:uncharacterized protein YqgC (DUF456 family)
METDNFSFPHQQPNFKNMEITLLILAGLCIIVGIIGCIVPGLPGTPIAYAGLWIAQASERVDFSWQTLLIWGIVTVVVSVLDYVVPAWGTKQFGGTRWGVWGSTIGVFVGLFFGFVGVIVAPLVGAILGELLGGKQMSEALRAGWGSFVGLLFGTLLKLICCGLMAVTLIQAIW